MTDAEKRSIKFLLLIAAAALIISMVAGPLVHDSIAIMAAVTTILISISITIYCLYFWKKPQ